MKPYFCLPLAAAVFLISLSSGSAQLFENLQALVGERYTVGNRDAIPTNIQSEVLGPKDIAVADLDGDGTPDFAASNKDGSVTLRFGIGNGKFGAPMHLLAFTNAPSDVDGFTITNYTTNVVCNQVVSNSYYTNYTVNPPRVFTNQSWVCDGTFTNQVRMETVFVDGWTGLRGLALADWNGDSRIDIAVTSPGESLIYLFLNQGSRVFAEPAQMNAWLGVRDLAAGDFDGDGMADLVAGGTTEGIVHYRGLGDGSFQYKTNHPDFGTDEVWGDFPQPAFYFRTFRLPGDNADRLVAGRAQRNTIWVLATNELGHLARSGIINARITSLDAGPLLTPASNNIPDLVTGFSREGDIEIFQGVTGTNGPFAATPSVSFFVPGGPRNLRVVDLDGDGWNDLVVVSQDQHKVLTYRNNGGTFAQASSSLTGLSPREMDIGDFNNDGAPDLAVLNRFSMDVTILLTSTNTSEPLGFVSLDSIYPVDGGVSGLDLLDFNGDSRLDVFQLHRDSAEFSVRITDTNGRLGAPTFYAINASQPAAQTAADVNGDGIPDMVSANLSGSVTVRLGLADGGFAEAQTFLLPADERGSLFALVPGDFDNDSKMDLAAGYLDCRVAFFKGDGAGAFVHTKTHFLIYEPRSMIAGDFDQDGDLDLIGGSWMSDFVVVENPGDLLTTTNLIKTTYSSGGSKGSNLRLVHINSDSDADLIVGGEAGFKVFLGSTGLTFTASSITSAGLGSSSFIYADLDADGDDDIASICAEAACLEILTLTNDMYAPVFTVPVPVTRYLASGDLDGDGLADLVGSGQVLWVALSSRSTTNSTAESLNSYRTLDGGLVINEVLSRNDTLQLSADGGKFTDWIEIFNGGETNINLAGLKLLLIRTNELTTTVSTNLFHFPNDIIRTNSHRLIICSGSFMGSYHSGFALPAEGATLVLLNATGAELDRINYPAQDADQSYARFVDGHRSFVVNKIPSPNAPNLDNGAVNPIVNLSGVDTETIATPRQLIRFRATARDDVGIVNVSVLWRRLDIPESQTKRIILFDDGINEDGPAFDGKFSGILPERLPAGAEIQFFLECTDLSDQVVTTPGNARLVSAGETPQAHTFTIGARRESLEISEVVADNKTGFRDERGGTPDWIEIRNVSSNTVSLAGVGISSRFFGDGERLDLSTLPPLAPSQHIVVFADSQPAQGPLHAPFELSSAGEEIILTGTGANGARYLIDAVTFVPLAADTAYSRLGRGGPWLISPPTPQSANLQSGSRLLIEGQSFYLGFPTASGRSYIVEYKDNLDAAWTPLAPLRGSGIEQAIRQTLGTQRFYRVREE